VTVHVVLSMGASFDHTGGENEFDIDAKDVRGVIKVLEARFPGLGEFLEEEAMCAIDGEIFESAIYEGLRDGCEIYFLPKLEAG
jgi:molybdopterin synthase sulfur carrier subunit